VYVYSPTSLAFPSPADVYVFLIELFVHLFSCPTHTPTHAEPKWSEWTTRMDEKVTNLLETLGKGSRFEGLDEAVQAQKELEEKVRGGRRERVRAGWRMGRVSQGLRGWMRRCRRRRSRRRRYVHIERRRAGGRRVVMATATLFLYSFYLLDFLPLLALPKHRRRKYGCSKA